MKTTFQDFYEEFIKEKEKRNNQLILSFLETLTSFNSMLKEDEENYKDKLQKLADLIKIKKFGPNELIMRNGEKGNKGVTSISQCYQGDLNIVLSGKIALLKPKPDKYNLSEKEYLFHLFKLRKNNEKELIRQTILLNKDIFPVEEKFDLFIKNIAYQKGKGEIYKDKRDIIDKAKETLKAMHSKKNKKDDLNKEKNNYSSRNNSVDNIDSSRSNSKEKNEVSRKDSIEKNKKMSRKSSIEKNDTSRKNSIEKEDDAINIRLKKKEKEENINNISRKDSMINADKTVSQGNENNLDNTKSDNSKSKSDFMFNETERNRQKEIDRNRRDLSIEEYVKLNKIDIYKSLRFVSGEKDLKEVKILNYTQSGFLTQGDYFREEQKNDVINNNNSNNPNNFNKNNSVANIPINENDLIGGYSYITVEETYLGIVDKKDYETLIKNVSENNNKKFYYLIFQYNMFTQISKSKFDKNYYNYFKFGRCDKGNPLISENNKVDKVYFILKGEYQISTYRNIIEVNSLIIHFKKLLKVLERNKRQSKFDALVSSLQEEEEKENEDLVINKNFKTDEQNRQLFEKRVVKLGISSEREIVGLDDFIDRSTSTAIISCECLSFQGEYYEISLSDFQRIYHKENDVKMQTTDYLMKKINLLLERLNIHKESVYNEIKKKDEEKANFHYKNYMKEADINKKNRLYSVENNSKFSNNALEILKNKTPVKNKNTKNLINNNNNANRGNNRGINNYYDFKKKNLLIKSESPYKRSSLFNNNAGNKIRYKNEIIGKYLYENLFNSYATINENIIFNDYTDNNIKNRNNTEREYSKDTENMNFFDCLILDKFNYCYSKVFNTNSNLNK